MEGGTHQVGRSHGTKLNFAPDDDDDDDAVDCLVSNISNLTLLSAALFGWLILIL